MHSEGSKEAFRRQAADRLAGMTGGQRRDESDRIAGGLTAWTAGRGYEVVLATLALPEEPDLTGFFDRWLAAGGRLAFARTGPGRSLAFHYCSGTAGPFETHRFGMREPPAAAPVWSPGPRTLCLVPGLAFAPSGDGGWARLGRGGGYYDRWLARHGGEVTTLGVGFGVQAFEAVPQESHDICLEGWAGPPGVRGTAD